MPRLVALVALTLPACVLVPREETVLVEDPFQDLLVDMDEGDVEIVAGGGETVRVERRFASTRSNPPTLTVRVEDGTLQVVSRCGVALVDLCDVDLRVFVPAEVSAGVGLGAGDVAVTGLEGDLVVEAGAGDMFVQDTIGAIELRTGAGDIDVVGVTGEVFAQTAAGDITGRELASPGTVVRTSAGDLELAFVEVGGVEAVTSAGDVSLRVPAGRYELDVSTAIGDVTIEGVTDEPDAVPLRGRSSAGDVDVRGV